MMCIFIGRKPQCLKQPHVFRHGILLGGRSTVIQRFANRCSPEKSCGDMPDIDAEEYFEPANHRLKILAP